MSTSSSQSADVRRKIETLSTTVSLPTVRRALGALEGEHPSARPGGSADPISTREYSSEDEARLIDWKLSARSGKPMITDRERLVTSRIWLMLDTGMQMDGSCPSGEHAWEVASNALCMFAALSCRRHDTISLVLANNAAITRFPAKGGLPQFERLLADGLNHVPKAPSNLEALLSYTSAYADNGAMVVLATSENSLGTRHTKALRTIAMRHPLTVVSISTLNPFAASAFDRGSAADGYSGRRVPSFMNDAKAATAVTTHRHYVASQINKELRSLNASLLQAPGSNAMFDRFISLVSTTARHASGPAAHANLPVHFNGGGQ